MRTWFLLALLAVCLCLGVGCSRDPEMAKRRYLESGQRYMEKGKFKEASIQFRNALQLDPRFVEAYYKLASVHIALREWQEAFNALQEAVELDPSRMDAHLSLGMLYLSAREFDRAADEGKVVLQPDPRNRPGY